MAPPARAALLFAGLATAAALPGEPSPVAPCRQPAELFAREGRSAEVRCDGRGPAVRGPARLVLGLRLDPNRASARTLQALPGIGPARAEALLQARRERRFESLADLERAHGIGPVLRARLEPWLAISAGDRPGGVD